MSNHWIVIKIITIAVLLQLIWNESEVEAHALINSNSYSFICNHSSSSAEITQQWQRSFDNWGRLLKSLDMPHGSWSGSDFAYDRNGNQTHDLSRGVADIGYHSLTYSVF